MVVRIPSALNMDVKDLSNPYRHKVALVKGGNIMSVATSTLGGGRYLNCNFGRSCHAEINAFKHLSYNNLKNPRKVAKDCLV